MELSNQTSRPWADRLQAAFTERMRAMLGEEYEAFLASYDKPVRPALRVNTLKLSSCRLKEIAPFIGDAVPWQENGFYCDAEGEVRPGKHPFHEAGLYYIQEASAMLPASLCPPVPGERVLDLCAAPGGKATQLAAALGGEGLLVANEIHPARAAILSRNIERMGIKNALVTNESPAALSTRFPAFFDKIVVDAPCSGEGMFRKEPDALTMWSPDNVALCAARQAAILDEAATMLRAGGHLVYSTCTFAPAENEGVVLAFLTRHPDFEVVPSSAPAVCAAREAGLLDGGHPEWVENGEQYPEPAREAMRHAYRVFPHHCDGEGHFAVLLRRTSDAVMTESPHRVEKKKGKNQDGKKGIGSKGKTASALQAFRVFDDFWRELSTPAGIPASACKGQPFLFGDKLCLLPAALGQTDDERSDRLEGLKVLRAGLCLGTLAGGGRRFEPDHAAALACDPTAIRALFPVEDSGLPAYEAATAYLRGETLPAGDLRGWVLVTYGGFPLGWGKASDGVIKNHYPKGLRWN